MKNNKSNKFSWALLIIVMIASASYYFITIFKSKFESSKGKKIYFADYISEAHQMMIEKYNELQKGRVEVVPINLPFEKFSTNERKELIARSLRGKSDRIDIFSVDYIWVERFAKWAENLEKYFTEQYRNEIIPYAIESCYKDNRLVAIPFKIDIGTMYYRPDLLRQLPDNEEIERKIQKSISWEELIEFGRKAKQYRNNFYLFPAYHYEGLVCSFMEGVLNQDRSFFDNGKIDMHSRPVRKALNNLVDLVWKYKLSPERIVKFDEVQTHKYFLMNNSLFMRSWPSFAYEYKHIYKRLNPTAVLKLAPLPHFAGFEPTAVFGGWNLMVSEFSKNKEEAVRFMKFLLLPENQEIMYKFSGSLPVIKKLYTDSSWTDDSETVLFFKNLLKQGVHRPFREDYTRISDIISYYANLAIKGEMSVDDAIDKMNEMIDSRTILIK